MRRVFLTLLLCLPAVSARAQLTVTWVPRADVNATLPPGLRLFEARRTVMRGGTTDSLRAWLVRGDTAGASWRFSARLGNGAQPLSAYAAEPGVLVAMNGGYFGGSTSYSLVARDGQTLAQNIGAVTRSAGTYYPTSGAMGLLQDGRFDVAWIYHSGGATYAYPNPSPNTQAGPPQPQPTPTFPAGGAVWPVRDGIGGGPVLVEGGQKRITFEPEVFFGSGIGDDPNGTLNPRTAVGYTAAGEVLMIVAEGRSSRSSGLTLSELADLFLQLGAREALNLDGGGSSQLRIGSRTIYGGDGRSLPSAVVLGPRTQATSGTVFEFDADPTKPHYRETGTWIESSNTPYHGARPARLNSTGGGDRATFSLLNIPSGPYNVYAWWVPSSNRATNTPFTIYRDGQAVRTVRLNQADPATASRWNHIGQFDLSPGDSIVVSDDAVPSNTFVVADGLRLTAMAVAAEAELRISQLLRIYPNPAVGTTTLELSSGPGVRPVVVYDLLGRAVLRLDVPPGAARVLLPLASLPGGLYVVTVGLARTTLVVRP
jgi:hypothetical protein